MASAEQLPHLKPDSATAAPTWRAAYSDRTAALMAAFSQLAYRPMPGEAVPAPPEGEDLKAMLAAGGFELRATFDHEDTQAYLAVRPDQFAVLAFRGTTDLADWKINLDLERQEARLHADARAATGQGLTVQRAVPAQPSAPEVKVQGAQALEAPIQAGRAVLQRGDGAPDVQVHAGFLRAYGAVREAVLAAVNANVPDNLGLYITGHSLGGALAQIASAALERDNLAACYTFGSPRVGTSNFDVVVKCPHYRVVNDNDVVPGIPFPSPWGYQHGGDARLIKPALRDRSILRRGRAAVVEVSIAVFSFVIAVFGNRIFVIDQHMIWNYRRHLEGIADAKSRQVSGSPPSQRLPPS